VRTRAGFNEYGEPEALDFLSHDRRRVANDGHQIAVSACLRPENAEAILGVVEGDPLDEAGEDFLGR
jgi:hypothetical protein